ncbi:DEAD/DEAH box helicase [Pseudotabrizicola formosa]|uniref:DEAD/DEAH box helicase n=1 Tax=Pseudotabrizicola formosa TaxID=2030009 RepID=UPI000CD19431|nr:DEAD/DEAH box helicase family protein [Pseudotabrizicola formosa]
MAAINFELKNYQDLALNRFGTFLRDSTTLGAEVAFMKATKFPYRQAPAVAEGTPFVCLRVPTGGGKTLMAAHSIGIAARDYLQTTNPMVLWLVPSTAILDQTIAALKDEGHHYRAALLQSFNRNFAVMTKAEALAMSKADATGGAVVIVSTIQSFRREDESGNENPEGLKVYDDAGVLMDHFANLTDDQIAPLDKIEGGSRPVYSLANLLKLHRPMVIVDEAHNSRTELSFRTLARFNPSLILELTATPQTEHKPERDKHASNILYSVSAAELKAEQMIKMPIRLTTDAEWVKTIGGALDCQKALEEAANAEKVETGEYIRPIILFQAQAASKDDPTRITWDKMEAYLRDDQRIPKDQIAVHTGPRKDLDGIPDIRSDKCPVRYIITVSKLKEGWDCPFAYILCSVADQVSATAVEQILGRVLRMPRAQRKRRDALNQSYAFIVSRSFDTTAQQLRDGLVEGAGFNPMEAAQIIAPQQNLGFADAQEPYKSDPLPAETAAPEVIEAVIDRLPPSVKTRLSFDTETRTLTYKGPMTREGRNLIHLAFAAIPNVAKTIDRLYAKSNQFQTSAADEDDKPPFIVPLLGFRKQGELQLFSQEHFLDLPWRLDECDPAAILERFRLPDTARTGEIDVGAQGAIEIGFPKKVQGDLALVIREPAWNSVAKLANWIDSGIVHPDITKPSAVVFITKAIDALIAAGHDIPVLARHKYDLRKAIGTLIGDLRGEREVGQYKALFAANTADFAVSADLSIIFDEQTYAPNQPYSGATRFAKHYTRLVGDLLPSGEEFDCAVHLDRLDKVRYWIRNVDRKKSSFWLQLPHDKFYPDFVAMLTDGRILVVEYKGGHLYEAEATKRQIGNVWAEASGEKCLFCMPTNRDYALIDRTIG